ncbi:hypothetical protein OG21DRAFT_1504852 [Imleria badia]|nr:hypothetical protein OG21DRAFT_1504852 [Imleria badia]
MGSTSIIIHALPCSASSLASNEKSNEFSSSSKSKSFVASHSESLHGLNAAAPMNGWQQNHLQFYPGTSLAPLYLYSGQDGNASDYTANQDISRNTSGLLDTKQWSPSPSLSASYATSGTHSPSNFTESHAFPNAVFDGFTGTFYHGTPACRVTPKPQVIPHSQSILDLTSGLSTSTTHYHATISTDVSVPHFSPEHQCFFVHQPKRPALSMTNVVPSSSPGSAEDITNLVYAERQASVVIYRAPERKDSRSRRCQRASVINIEGLWIDKDDLYSGAGQGSGMISVHECHWAKASDPCGMWIIGSRSRVGTHIRKWHTHKHADGRVKCLWGGCTTSKAMLKDSINRHLVTVHLDEEFHCQGCNEIFSRKDVYDQHVESGEVCREAGAAIVYGTERREIDARQELQRGGHTFRYAGR